MKHKAPAFVTRCLAPLAIVVGVALAPREARAQFRLGAYGGVERISGGGSASTMFMARAEGAVGLLPWFQVGAYGETLSGGDQGKTGWGAGAIATLRPSLPGFSIDPMGYASAGYQRAPAGAPFNAGFLFEVGGGLSWHVIPVLDLELRGGYVGLFGDDGMNGFNVFAGLSLHP